MSCRTSYAISGAQQAATPKLTTGFPSFRIPSVDDLEPFLLSSFDGFDVVPFDFFDGRGKGLVDGFVGESDDLRFRIGVFGCLQFGRVFLADDLIRGEMGEEEGRDESLTGVIRDWTRNGSIFNAATAEELQRTGDG